MIINPVISPHMIDEFDFLFTNGLSMPVTIDRDNGDMVDFDSSPAIIHIKLSAKRSISSSDVMLPAEDIMVYTSHIISISHRSREVLPLTPDQAESFKTTLLKLSSTIQ